MKTRISLATWLLMAWLTLGIILIVEMFVGFFVEITALFILVPGYLLYMVGIVMGMAKPAQGPLWEGGHGPPVLNLQGVILFYIIIPSTIMTIKCFNGTNRKKYKQTEDL